MEKKWCWMNNNEYKKLELNELYVVSMEFQYLKYKMLCSNWLKNLYWNWKSNYYTNVNVLTTNLNLTQFPSPILTLYFYQLYVYIMHLWHQINFFLRYFSSVYVQGYFILYRIVYEKSRCKDRKSRYELFVKELEFQTWRGGWSGRYTKY